MPTHLLSDRIFSIYLGLSPQLYVPKKSNFKRGNILLAQLFSNTKIFLNQPDFVTQGKSGDKSLPLRNKGWSKSIFLKELAIEIEDRKKKC